MKGLLIAALALISLNADAQDYWTGVTFTGKLARRWEVNLENEIRFRDNFSVINKILAEPSVSFYPAKWITVRPAYRYTWHPAPLHRFMADLTPTLWNKKMLEVSFRLRYQQEFEKDWERYGRIMTEIQYNHSGELRGYLSYEPFYPLDGTNVIDRHRFTFGVKTELSKSLSANLFYRVQKDREEGYFETSHIFGLSFSFGRSFISK